MLNLNPFHPRALSVAAALALAATGALAQTASSTATTTIGVTPQEAQEALQKAKPQADTGTLVRTDESAAERTKDMAQDAKQAVTPDARNTRNANPSEPRNSGATTGTVNNTTTPNAAMGISGTVPGADATSGTATNMRNNPGTKAGNGNRTDRPARADRN